MKILTAICALILSITSTAHAQLYTVDATDPGADFQSLKVAIKTVPEGATLLVLSDMYDSVDAYHIRKDLTIVGQLGKGTGKNGHPRTMGYWVEDSTLHLSRLEINYGAPDWDGLNLYRSTAFLDEVEIYGYEHEGIEVDADSKLIMTASYAYCYPHHTSAVTLLVDGLTVLKDCIIECDTPFYAAYVTGKLYHSVTQFIGDIDTEGDGLVHQLHPLLFLDESTFRLGQQSTLTGYSDCGYAYLFYNFTGISLPLDIGTEDPLLLAAPFFIIPLYTSSPDWSWKITFDIPNDQALIGFPIYFQQYYCGKMSCVEAGIVGS